MNFDEDGDVSPINPHMFGNESMLPSMIMAPGELSRMMERSKTMDLSDFGNPIGEEEGVMEKADE